MHRVVGIGGPEPADHDLVEGRRIGAAILRPAVVEGLSAKVVKRLALVLTRLPGLLPGDGSGAEQEKGQNVWNDAPSRDRYLAPPSPPASAASLTRGAMRPLGMSRSSRE